MRALPNLITASRLALTPVVVFAVLRHDWRAATLWFALAAFTDFLDGLAARRLQVSSRTGQFLDPVADKVLLMAVTLALAAAGHIPVWFVAVVVGRDAVLLVSSVAGLAFTRYRNYRPTQLGKLSTLLQIAVVTAALALPPGWAGWLAWPSAAVTIASGIHYLCRPFLGGKPAVLDTRLR